MALHTVTDVQQDDSLPMAGTVLLREDKSWGNVAFYPANALAEAICQLTGTQTLPARYHATLKRMGFTVMTSGHAPRRL